MFSFTLDTNCIIAIDERRPEACAISVLAKAHLTGAADVAVVAMSASEKQKDGRHIKNFATFVQRLDTLGLGHLPVLAPMWYLDITFLDWCLLSDAAMESLERKIHEVLFPNIEFLWTDYCRVHLGTNTVDARWRNAKCDVQALWTHVFNKRDVFVTSDRNFHSTAKKTRLVGLGAGRIEFPESAASLS